MSGFNRLVDGGVELFVRLTPRGGTEAFDGVAETADGRSHLKARVRAAPEKGAANKALEKLLATSLGLPRSHVSVVSGGTSRLKTLRISGDPAEILRKLDALGGAS